MDRRRAWVVGGVVLVGLVFAVWIGIARWGAVQPDDGGAALNEQAEENEGKPKPPARPASAVYQPAPAALADAAETLYTGTAARQTGVKPGMIEARRAAILRGRVKTPDGKPVAGANVAVHHHPEFGSTQTAADGSFDLAVNGGGMLCVNYQSAGHLPLCRHVRVPWQDYVWLPDVVLTKLDPDVTKIKLNDPAPVQVARGKVVKDKDGERRATMFFFHGTKAEMFRPDRSRAPLSTLSVRITEYTVGESGPAAMPAKLPPTSAYTYACELTADEVAAAGGIKVGGKDVLLSQPASFYLENFLKFPVGTPIPMGYFDNDRGAWVAADSGQVIQVLSVNNQLAEIDLDGKGKPADAAALKKLAISDAERRQLALLYKPGQALWRVPMHHFSTPDLNQAPSDGTAPEGDGSNPPRTDCPPPTGQQSGGSVIDIHNQILREEIAIAGTGLRLHYTSGRTAGFAAGRSLDIPLSGANVPKSLKRIDLEVLVAGQKFAKSFPGKANQNYTFVWDGKNGYGRPLAGSQTATVRLGYVYDGVYGAPARFGEPPLRPTPTRSRQEFTFWREERVPIGSLDARTLGLGGWSLSEHHVYDPIGRVLLRGDGRRWSGAKGTAQTLNQSITTVAGGGSKFVYGDGGPATQARLDNLKPPIRAGSQRNRVARFPRGLAVGADGTLYVADGNSRIRKVAPDGTISTVAGGGKSEPKDGTSGIEAKLNEPRSLAVGPDGSVYFVDTAARRIRRLSPQGLLTTVAGTGSGMAGGDGGPALKAQFNYPTGLAVAADGTLYVADVFDHRVRRIGPDGTITTVAGTGKNGYSGDGGPGVNAQLYWPNALALAADGSLFISDSGNYIVRRLSPAGILTTVAGTHRTGWKKGFGGDNGPALKAKFNETTALALGPDGELYIADTENHRIRRVATNGVITTVAGNGKSGFAGDGGSASAAELSYPTGLAVGPDGSLYCYDGRAISDEGQGTILHRIRRISPSLPGFSNQEMIVPCEGGRNLFKFDNTGRHLESRNSVTQALTHRFHYDKSGRLSKVDDAHGTLLTIERDKAGYPTALVSRYGQRTTLHINDQGDLAKVVTPADEEYRLTYHAGGLLASFQPPGRDPSRFVYDSLGRLAKDEHPGGGFFELKRSTAGRNHDVAMSTALTPATTYRVERPAGGSERRITRRGSGAETVITTIPEGGYDTRHPDGTLHAVRFQPDPRWGNRTLLMKTSTVTTPRGRKATTSQERTALRADPRNPLSLKVLTDTTTVNGRKFTRTFDVGKRQITLRTPAGRVMTDTLNEQGRVIKRETPGVPPVVFRYDKFGRLDAVRQGEGDTARTLSLEYDAAGRLARVSNPHRGDVRFAYDKAGRLAKRTYSDGREVLTTFDPQGNLCSLTPPGKTPHTFDFTPGNMPKTYNPPAVGNGKVATGYEFDRDRRLTKITRADGTSIAMNYTPAGLLDSVITPTGKLAFTVDAKRHQLTKIEAPDGGLTFAYDGFLPTGATWSGAVKGTVSQTWDNDFRIVSRKVNNGPAIPYGYDGDGLLIKAGDLALDRDPKTGFLQGTRLGKVATAHEYSPFGERKRFTAKFDDKDLLKIDYERDALGRIIKKIETIAGETTTFTYAYDRAGRLTDVTRNGQPTGHYEYDSNGNRLLYKGQRSAPFQAQQLRGKYDAQDRIQSYGSATFKHNANGDLESKTEAGKKTALKYDALGNLRVATVPDGTKIEYLTDGLNRRIGKKVNGKLVQGFLWQSRLRPAAELDGDGKIVSRFIYATGINVPEYMERAGKTYRLIKDHLGSVRLLVELSTGQVVQRMDYDEFGNVLRDTSPGFQPFGYAGGLRDPPTTLVRFGARDYDATTGRWTGKDPIGFPGGDANLYAYVRNDPINLADPDGLTYVNVNSSGYTPFGAGGNAGVIFSNTGWYPYVGVGIGTPGPGASVHFSESDVSAGTSFGVSGDFGVGATHGIDSSGSWFGEGGIGTPGANANANYTWRFRWPGEWWRDRNRARERHRQFWDHYYRTREYNDDNFDETVCP